MIIIIDHEAPGGNRKTLLFVGYFTPWCHVMGHDLVQLEGWRSASGM